MRTTTTKRTFLKGMRDGSPFLIVIAPFSMLFGVVGTEAGLNLAQVMGFSVLVIAGSAQFTAIQLMTENTPVLIVLASALAINLRMAMYSASMISHFGPLPLRKRVLVSYLLVDQSYASAMVEYENHPRMTLAHKYAYFLGVMTIVAPFWYAFTYVGAVLGTSIPPEYALDFAVPITFLALIMPALRTLAHVAAAVVSVVLALTLSWIPYNLWLLVAAFCAMVTGAQVELWLERRR